jgi:hypothetical protein
MDSSSFTELAHSIGPILTPFLPYLIKGVKELGKEAFKTIGKKAAGEEWDKAKEIWEKLFPYIKKQPGVKKRIEELAKNTSDPDINILVGYELKKVLKTLPEKDVSAIQNIIISSTNESRNTFAYGVRSVAIGGNSSGNTIITGDQTLLPKGKR